LSYKSIFTRSFTREFDKLPRDVKERILEALKKVAEFPYAGIKLRGKLEGLWRWKLGKYRIIYLMDEKEKAIVFLDVGLRKAIYR